MNAYTFNDGTYYYSNLKMSKFNERLKRLDTLSVLVEGYEEGEGLNIYKKVNRALENRKNFNGIIRLNTCEKDFLNYLREDEQCLRDIDKETLDFYIKY